MIEPTRPGDEVPVADLIAQRTPIEDTAEDTAEDTGTGTDGAERFFPTPVVAGWDADEADQLEQTITVPLPEEDYPRPELDR